MSSGRIQVIWNRLVQWAQMMTTWCRFLILNVPSLITLPQLRQSVHPNSDEGNYGISLYINAVSDVTRLPQFQD